jgi:hypothetical protein
MIKWRRLAYITIVVVTFLVLSVVAAVEYSGNEDSSNKIKQDALYRRVQGIIESSQEFFANWPVKKRDEANKQEDSLVDNWKERIKDYIEISRSKEGLMIIMRNSQGEFFRKIWPIFNKNKD